MSRHKQISFKYWVILSALVITGTHWVSADGKFFFSDKTEFVRVKKVAENPFKFTFSRCRPEGGCVEFGKKHGYTLEDVRVQEYKLEEKRERGHLASADARDLETLQEIIQGIESPRLVFPNAGYAHNFKGGAEQFVHVVDERLGAK